MATATPDASSLAAFLQSKIHSPDHHALCTSVIPAIISSFSSIASALRTSHHVSLAGTANAFGDDQLNVDVAAEELLRAALARCPAVVTASSEEDPVERPARDESDDAAVAGEQERYTVAFDPLDGSSIIAPNWTVGTIVGIWEGATVLRQSPADRQVAAILAVYGPRTTAVVAVRVPGCEPLCVDVAIPEEEEEGGAAGGCEIVRPQVRLHDPPFKTRYFAPANLRAAAEEPRYMDLVTQFIQSRYTLRYSGGLVPDVVHALVKGHGVYISPVTSTSKAKLRRVYELFPVALIVECAGGKAVDPADGREILERPAEDTDERAGLVCGTREDVEKVVKALLG